MLKVGDIVRWNAGFLTRQFKMRAERIEKARMVGIIVKVNDGMLPSVEVRWGKTVAGRTELAYGPCLEVIG